MKVNRFFYTGPANGKVLHRCFSSTKTEGAKTACGRFVQKGWPWWIGKPILFGKLIRRMCSQCESA